MLLLENIRVVLFQTRFPENVGSCARACANFGCGDLRLARPMRWQPFKAAPLATRCGMTVLDNIKVHDSLSAALGDCNAVWGTSARTGGWRKNVCLPEEAAKKICAAALAGEKTALLFGPEDRGLANEDLALCAGIIHIPVESSCASLNLAQSVLLVLYECARIMRQAKNRPFPANAARRINLAQQEILENELKKLLAATGGMKGKNPDYYFVQWHDIITRASLRSHEFDALMGFCRNMKRILNHMNRE